MNGCYDDDERDELARELREPEFRCWTCRGWTRHASGCPDDATEDEVRDDATDEEE